MCPTSMPRWTAACLAISLTASLAGSAQTPAGYDDFEIWDSQLNPESLQEFILENPYVFIPSGTHEIDNPVAIATAGPLYIHGDGRNLTTLVATDPSKPLFEVVSATHVGIANVRIEGDPLDAPFTAFEFLPGPQLPTGFVFDLQDTLIRRGGLVIRKAGSYHLQGNTINGARAADSEELEAGIVLDHPAADLFVVGGKLLEATVNLHQISGHVEVHSALLNGQRLADIVLTTPSPHGAHFVIGTRTEGTKDPNFAPHLVRVPPTALPVDVVVKANEFYGAKGQPASPMIDYNASGTVWVLGNRLDKRDPSLPPGDYARLVDGFAPLATIVGVGNQVVTDSCPVDLFPVVALSRLTAWNRFDKRSCSASAIPYNVHWEEDGGVPEPLPDFPEPPQTALDGDVPFLTLPRMNALIGNLIDVTAPPYNATPNDAADDDADAIQAALNSDKQARIYLPPGTYHTRKPIRFDTSTCLNANCKAGGRIVGAGSEVTTIHNVNGTPDSNHHGQVFDVRSLSYATVQGLTLKTDTGEPGEARGVFHLGDDNQAGGTGSPSTISVNFYDMVFDGGDFGLGILLDRSSQADATLCVHCTFSNSTVGLLNGGSNAVNTSVLKGVFENNEIAVAQGIDTGSGITEVGGTVRILSGESKGTSVDFSNFLHRVLYVNDFESSAPQLSVQECNHGLYVAMIENSTLSPASTSTDPYLHNQAAPQVLFLNSTTPNGSVQMDIRNCGTKSETSMLSLFSDIGGFSTTLTTPGQSYIDRID